MHYVFITCTFDDGVVFFHAGIRTLLHFSRFIKTLTFLLEKGINVEFS